MATGLTSTYNIPYPLSTDPVNVHGDLQTMANKLDILFGNSVLTSGINSFTNTNTFSMSTSTSAVTITQQGTGNAFTVEDTSPDSTPFIIDSSGHVAIGKTTASVELDVVGAGTFTGAVTAASFSGSGASLTSLNGTNIATGTVAAARVDTAIARLAGPTFTGTVVLPSTTSIGTVTSTELGYLSGITSAIQTQISAKAPLASPTFTGTVTIPAGANISGYAPLASPTFTGTVGLPTGSTSAAPIKFTSGTNLTTPVSGAIEYDGTVVYATPSTISGRSVIPSVLFTSGTATFTNIATAQNIFPTANDTLNIPVGTYMVESVINVATTGATSNSLGFSILGSGGATLGTVALSVTTTNGTAATTNTSSTTYVTSGTNTAITAAVAAATNRTLYIRGLIRCTVQGTIIPQITYSSAPGAAPTGQAANFMVLYPVGSSTVVSNGTWA